MIRHHLVRDLNRNKLASVMLLVMSERLVNVQEVGPV
jgi:hypothetical protein